MKHTQGPWFVDRIENEYSVGSETNNICRLDSDGNAECAANAALIAAAPELLEALKKAEYFLNLRMEASQMLELDESVAYGEIVAAIAAAEGTDE